MQNVSQEQIEKWKNSIQEYKNTHYGMYDKYPSEKLIESYCKIYKIPYPIPKIEVIEFDFLE